MLLSQFNVGISDIFDWDIKGIPNEKVRLWPRWIGLFLGRQILLEQKAKDEKYWD